MGFSKATRTPSIYGKNIGSDKIKVYFLDYFNYLLISQGKTFLLFYTELYQYYYNIVIAEVKKEMTFIPDYFTFRSELFNTIVYSKDEDEIDKILTFMVSNVVSEKIDIEEPIDFAILFGGKVSHRKIISTSKIHRSLIQ